MRDDIDCKEYRDDYDKRDCRDDRDKRDCRDDHDKKDCRDDRDKRDWRDDRGKRDWRDDRDKKDCDDCKAKHPLPKPVILECGTGSGFSVSANGTTTAATSTPKTVGTVSIDTTCLCKPKTKVDFCSNIHFVPRDDEGSVQLEFQLFRACDFRAEESLGTWLFEIEDEDDRFAQTFTFCFCDCSSCPGCCVYTVKVNVVEIDDATVSVTNTHISAIAQGNCD